MASIVICEKPSQARALQAAIGEKYGKIYPASGHLYTLADPEAYGPEWANRAGFAVYRPKVWLKCPTTGNDDEDQKRLDRVRATITTALKSASRVYIATDCDREGEVIGREILEVNNYKGPAFRVLFNADDADSLREAFTKAIPVSDMEHIYQSGLARERADYIWNLSLTRAATAALIRPDHFGVIGIGRVKTPTLGIICRRELQVEAWKPSDAHVVRLTLETPAGAVILTSSTDHIFENKAAADAVANAIVGNDIAVGVEVTRRRQGPPKPPDLNILQMTAARWGWSADRTLEIGQALYSTHKIMTYVRASARYYPESSIDEIPLMLEPLLTLPAYSGIASAAPVIRRGKGGVFSDEGLKGESHYAIMPNPKMLSEITGIVARLTPDETRLFDLVCRLFLQSVMPDREYEAIKATAEQGGITYSGSMQRTLVGGWTALRAEAEGDDDDEPNLSQILQSGTYLAVKAEARPQQATPPRRYSMGTLIAAMINAWKFVQDERARERLKDAKGIGTVATRSTVIRGLIDQAQIAEGKTTFTPTQSGRDLFKTLHSIDPRLVDPVTTAEWELQIDEIARGQIPLDVFLDRIEAETARIVKAIQVQPPRPHFGRKREITPGMIKAVEAIQKAKRIFAPAGWRDEFSIADAFLRENGKAHAKQ
jgi:DNA topoisomerase-3